jgi:hypothetical protein
MFDALRHALEQQRDRIAEQLAAVVEAEAAIGRMRLAFGLEDAAQEARTEAIAVSGLPPTGRPVRARQRAADADGAGNDVPWLRRAVHQRDARDEILLIPMPRALEQRPWLPAQGRARSSRRSGTSSRDPRAARARRLRVQLEME